MMMMKCYAAFGLFLSITVTIQSQLTVIWQGVPVTGPLLIYHSEIQQTVNSNSLTCRHPTGPVAWYLATGNTRLTEFSGTFINVITNEGRQAQLMRGTEDRQESEFDGLWTCRLNGATGAGAFHVGIYDDTPTTRNGAITSDPTVRGQAFFYISNPPSFQLVGDSTGGPPTTNYWTRNGINITNNNTFNISISFTGSHDRAGHRAANYRSTLTVTGRQPGVYQYHVSNRRTNGTRSSRNITIDDLLAPTIFSMSLLTSTSVNISWTQPMGGLMVDIYRVALSGMCPGFSHTREETTTSTSIVIDGLKKNSSYTVTISAVNNQSNAINTTSGLTITTLAAAPSGPPVIVMPPTVSSRSITVNWTEISCIQRNGKIIRYEVEFGPSGEGNISGRSFTVNGLTPFTIYIFQVRGVNSEGPGPYSDLIAITTSEAAPGPVFSLMSIPTLSMVVLTWSPPQQQNGIITQYMVTYRVNGSAPVTRDINNPDTTTFTIPSLFPQTTISYISVRASTSAGHGPEMTFEDVVTLTRPPEVMGVDVEILTDTLVRVSWERILNIPEITHYTVFYSRAGRQDDPEQNKKVAMTDESVVIENLSGGARSYQFIVVAVATVNNVEIYGERSIVTLPSPTSNGDVCIRESAVPIAVVMTFLLTIILYTTALLVKYYIYRVCYANRAKSSIKQTEKGNTEDTYEVITTKVDSHDFAMKECTAYGPVSSTQAQYEVTLSPQTEGTYESV